MTSEPIVVVVTRHPDFADEIEVFGADAKVIYLDEGASFDVTKLHPDDDNEEVRDWCAFGILEAEQCGRADARDYAINVIDQVLEAIGVEDRAAFMAEWTAENEAVST